MAEQVPDASDGHVRWWKASQYLPVHGIVALARKHGRDTRGPGGFHGRENTQFVVDLAVMLSRVALLHVVQLLVFVNINQDVPANGFK